MDQFPPGYGLLTQRRTNFQWVPAVHVLVSTSYGYQCQRLVPNMAKEWAWNCGCLADHKVTWVTRSLHLAHVHKLEQSCKCCKGHFGHQHFDRPHDRSHICECGLFKGLFGCWVLGEDGMVGPQVDVQCAAIRLEYKLSVDRVDILEEHRYGITEGGWDGFFIGRQGWRLGALGRTDVAVWLGIVGATLGLGRLILGGQMYQGRSFPVTWITWKLYCPSCCKASAWTRTIRNGSVNFKAQKNNTSLHNNVLPSFSYHDKLFFCQSHCRRGHCTKLTCHCYSQGGGVHNHLCWRLEYFCQDTWF